MVEIKWSSLALSQRMALKIKEAQVPGHNGRFLWCGPISTREERQPAKYWAVLKSTLDGIDGGEKVFCERTRSVWFKDKKVGRLVADQFLWDSDVTSEVRALFEDAVVRSLSDASK